MDFRPGEQRSDPLERGPELSGIIGPDDAATGGQPERLQQHEWKMRWNPYQQCSWPPEDVAIEKFRTHVKDRALSIIGTDLARSEKFTTSLMDGLEKDDGGTLFVLEAMGGSRFV